MNFCAVILAAGRGKRMKSSRPKVLHEILNRPMILYTVDAVKALDPADIIIVVRQAAEEIVGSIGDPRITYVTQEQPLGTGDALGCTRDFLMKQGRSPIIILNGDCPLITPDALCSLLQNHTRDNNDLSFLSFIDDNASGYGRVLRDDSGAVTGVIEEKHLTSDTESVNELNGGVYAMEPHILNYVDQLKQHSSSGEYYLTDLVGLTSRQGGRVNAYHCHSEVILGVNTREDLRQVSEIIRKRAAVSSRM